MFEDHDFGSDEPYGICDNCGNSCQAVRRDMGIGSYEFHGSRGVHHDWQLVSPCCDAEVVPGGNTVLATNVYTARREHKAVKTIANPAGKILPGQRYQRVVIRHWRKGGPRWITTVKKLLPPIVPVGT